MAKRSGQDETHTRQTFKIAIRPAAEAEMLEAYEFYEGRVEGLGDRFEAAVRECLEEIRSHPQRFRFAHKKLRRAILRDRFPYSLYYFVEGCDIVVVACMHASRDPKRWQERVP